MAYYYRQYTTIYKVATNFLNALKYAKGDTIYLCDQDDVWYPDKIMVCEKDLIENVVTIHRRQDVDQNLKPFLEKNINTCDNRKATFIQSLKVSHFQGACMAFTKELKIKILENIDLFYRIPLSQDHAIGYVAMAYFPNKIHFEKKQLIWYRRHGDNVSPTGEKSKNSLYFKIVYRINDILFYTKLLYRKIKKGNYFVRCFCC